MESDHRAYTDRREDSPGLRLKAREESKSGGNRGTAQAIHVKREDGRPTNAGVCVSM